jgi:hypothetical protein
VLRARRIQRVSGRGAKRREPMEKTKQKILSEIPMPKVKPIIIVAEDNEAEDCTYYLWPDGTTCYEEDLEDYLSFKSDDYIKISSELK